MNLRLLLRLWLSRLFWLAVAAALTVLVAHLPAGIEQSKAGTSPTMTFTTVEPKQNVRSDPTDPFLIEPWEKQFRRITPLTWSASAYAGRVADYLDRLLSGKVTVVPRGVVRPAPIPLMPIIQEAWLKSLLIFGAAVVGGVLLGVVVGSLILGSRWARVLSLSVSVGSLSIPDFYVVLLGQLATIWTYHQFSIRLWTVGVPGGERHWLLPILALSIAPIGYAARLTAGSLDEIMRQDFIRTARAKGIPEVRVIFGHALRNALPRVLNGLPAIVNVTLSSLVVVELLTSWAGLGMMLIPVNNQPAVVATAGLVFSVWFAVVDGLTHSLRLVTSPQLRHGLR